MRRKNYFQIPLFNTFLLLIGLFVIILSLIIFSGKTTSNRVFTDLYTESPSIPKRISFCGEKVPLNKSNVSERLDRELIVNKFWHSSTILALKRSTRWFPVIEPILKKYKVPNDMKYLCVIESNLDNVVSPKGATGFWQLMKSVAIKYKLKVNKEIDERYNVEKSTVAACKYLISAKKLFKSWTLAAAAYNMGRTGLLRQIKRQKSKNYYNLILGEETERYIFRILALKRLFENPQDFNFKLLPSDYYKPIKVKPIKVKRTIKNLSAFAKKYKISYGTLKLFNPWLRANKLTVRKGESFVILIPTEKKYHF